MPGRSPAAQDRPPLSVPQYEAAVPIRLSDRRGGGKPRRALRVLAGKSPILVAGPSTPRRAALLADLRQTLPEGTPLQEVGTLEGVLERAPSSRMVILAGALDGFSPGSLTRMLAQRHPRLPVISLGAAAFGER